MPTLIILKIREINILDKKCIMPVQSIVVQVGQCGNQVGHRFWSKALKEYISEPENSFFYNDKCSNPKARAVLVDTEDSVISAITKKSNFYDSKCKIVDSSGAGNNWAVGHYDYFKIHKSVIEEKIRKQAEKCDCLQGIFVCHSMGGGTGSGLGSAITKSVREWYPETELFSLPVYPSMKNDDVITSPYNSILATNAIASASTCIFPFDNQGLEAKFDELSKSKVILKVEKIY